MEQYLLCIKKSEPTNELIFNFATGYMTSKKHLLIKLFPNPHNMFCPYQQVETFLHMVWECE